MEPTPVPEHLTGRIGAYICAVQAGDLDLVQQLERSGIMDYTQPQMTVPASRPRYQLLISTAFSNSQDMIDHILPQLRPELELERRGAQIARKCLDAGKGVGLRLFLSRGIQIKDQPWAKLKQDCHAEIVPILAEYQPLPVEELPRYYSNFALCEPKMIAALDAVMDITPILPQLTADEKRDESFKALLNTSRPIMGKYLGKAMNCLCTKAPADPKGKLLHQLEALLQKGCRITPKNEAQLVLAPLYGKAWQRYKGLGLYTPAPVDAALETTLDLV